MSDVIQRTILDVQASGADSVTILKQAMLELQDKFKTATVAFDEQKITANQLIGVLKNVAAGMKGVADIANADAEAMARAEVATAKLAVAAEKAAAAADVAADRRTRIADRLADAEVKASEKTQAAIVAAILAEDKRAKAVEAAADRIIQANTREAEAREGASQKEIQSREAATQKEIAAAARAAAANAAFIDKVVADLARRDAEEARLDAQSKARMDAKLAKDKATMDAIGAAADKAAAEAEKAADRIAQAMAQGAEKMATAAMKARQAFEETVIPLESLVVSAMKLKSAGIEQAFNAAAAAADKEEAELEQLNKGLQNNAQNVGMATRATREQIQALKDMGIIQDAVTTKVASGKGQFGGFATAAEQAANKTKNVGYAMMNASYLIQDMQYGVGAVANNIGLMAVSMGNAMPGLDAFITKIGVPGGLSGLGAGIMFAAVAVDLLHKNWGSIESIWAGGLPPKMMGDTKELTERLKELDSKTWKTALDYRNITEAREELRRLSADEATYRRLKEKKTESQEKQSELVSEAITEGGGGQDYQDSVDNVVKAVERSRGEAPSTMLVALREQHAKVKELWKESAAAGLDVQDFMNEAGQLEDRIKAQVDADKVNRFEAAKKIVSGAASGRTGDLAELTQIFEAHPEEFAKGGIDLSRLGAGLKMAADPMAEKRAANEKRIDDQDAARQKAIDQTNLEMKAANEKAVDDAEKAKIQKWNQWIQETTHDPDTVEANAEAKEAEAERKKAVGAASQRFQPGFEAALTRATLDHAAHGATADQSFDRLLPQLRARLIGSGVPDQIASEVATEILGKVMDKVGSKIQVGVEGGAGNVRQVAAAQLAGVVQNQMKGNAQLGTTLQLMNNGLAQQEIVARGLHANEQKLRAIQGIQTRRRGRIKPQQAR